MNGGVEITRCLMCRRCVTGGTAFCVRHVVAGVGRPFVKCSLCELPCRSVALCVVHLAAAPRSAFEEDVLAWHRKTLLRERATQLGLARSVHTGSDDEEEDEVATPSWRVHHVANTDSPLLRAHLEEDKGVIGDEDGRRNKLRKVEQLYALQVSRLEDILRSCDNQIDSSTPSLNSAVRSFADPVPEPRVPERMMELSQREAGSGSMCKHKGCAQQCLQPSQYCFAHICDDSKQTLFSPCSVCKTPVLRSNSSDTCPTHTPPAPKMKPISGTK